MTPEQTPNQTVGPFFHIGIRPGEEDLVKHQKAAGQRIYIQGRVLDGDGQPVSDALIEIWHADANGVYSHPSDPRHAEADPHFRGFGRCATDDEGYFWFKTIKPGSPQGDSGPSQAPHISVRVLARGMLIHALTRLYFPDEAANENDPVLQSITDPERRSTLIASLAAAGEFPTYLFDIRLQGERESVFFNP